MLSVGITALKNKLGKYVRLAARGETVLITKRGRVVAQFVPPRPPAARLDEPMKQSEADRAHR